MFLNFSISVFVSKCYCYLNLVLVFLSLNFTKKFFFVSLKWMETRNHGKQKVCVITVYIFLLEYLNRKGHSHR